jgi:hypothetical protein
VNRWDRRQARAKVLSIVNPSQEDLMGRRTTTSSPAVRSAVAGAGITGAAIVGARLIGPTAMGPLSIAVCAVGAVAIGRVAIANAVIRKLNAGEVAINSLKVQELEINGRRWPEPAAG